MASRSTSDYGRDLRRRRRRVVDKDSVVRASPFGEWKDSSLTMRILSANAERLSSSVDTVKKGFRNAQQSVAARAKLLKYLKFAAAQQAAVAARESAKANLSSTNEATDVNRILKEVGSKQEAKFHAGGTLLFGGLLFVAGAQPWLLPSIFILFLVIALPWRAYHFHRQKWDFFLLDFCYWANLATGAFLLFAPRNPYLGAAMYALADGPLAAALIAWQSAWVFNSAPHVISVLMHLLPGLAMYAHKHFPDPPATLRGLLRPSPSGSESESLSSAFHSRTPPGGVFWLFVMPMVFYLAWQFLYFLVVQVACRSFILKHGYDTSYTTLARRAAKTNNFWNRLVRKGSISRRVFLYGLIQALYTAGVLLVFYPTYHVFWLATLWQAVKVAVPVYYGSRFQCEKVPRHTAVRVLKLQRLHAAQTI